MVGSYQRGCFSASRQRNRIRSVSIKCPFTFIQSILLLTDPQITPAWPTSTLISWAASYRYITDLICSDSSQAYYMRDADLWTKIDYKAKAETWMKPLVKGSETGLVCIPGNWYLEDMTPMMWVQPTADACHLLNQLLLRGTRFMKASPNSHGWVSSQIYVY